MTRAGALALEHLCSAHRPPSGCRHALIDLVRLESACAGIENDPYNYLSKKGPGSFTRYDCITSATGPSQIRRHLASFV